MSMADPDIQSTLTPPVPARPNLVVAAAEDPEILHARLERGFNRDVIAGVLIGIAVCVPIWIGLVFLAIVGNGEPLLPTLGMAAGVGAFAGMFFGLFGGTVYGNRALERRERESRGLTPR